MQRNVSVTPMVLASKCNSAVWSGRCSIVHWQNQASDQDVTMRAEFTDVVSPLACQ